MYLKLSCCQLKTHCCLLRILYWYIKLKTNARKILISNTQKGLRKGSKHNTKENHQNVKEERKRRKDRSHKHGQKIVSKMEVSTSYPPKKKKEKERKLICMLPWGEAHFRNRDTQRLKVKRWKNTVYANGNYMKVGLLISQNRF